MNRQMRRMAEREQRRQRKQDQQRGKQSPAQRAQRRAATQEQQDPFLTRVGRYLREVRAELKRVSWPTREQMVAYTTVTVITTLALTGYVWGLDRILERAVVVVLSFGS